MSMVIIAPSVLSDEVLQNISVKSGNRNDVQGNEVDEKLPGLLDNHPLYR
jgi:hypothetical protein